MLTGRTVVCMSTIEWGFSWQPNQEIMYRLAEAGNRVLFIETTGARNVRLTDWRRLLWRLRFALGASASLERTHPNLLVYSPLVLPFPHSRLTHSLNTRVVFRTVDTWLRENGSGNLLFWAFLPSAMTLALIEHVRPALVIYQCMGDTPAGHPVSAIARSERELMRRCDLAFANSLRLLQHVRRFTPEAHLFRAGVDLEAFQRTVSEAEAPPPELADISDPIAGYVGSIHPWLDLELLAGAARELSTWQFVMIGPLLRDVSRLRGLSNIRWLGQQPHHELHRYIRHFDVGIIPYVLDEYTASAYPGKLNEYLALGKPVVATPLPELVDYNREFGNVVYLAGGASAFADAIRRAQESSASRRQQYLAVARANSWGQRVEAMSAIIERLLTPVTGPPSLT